MAADIAIVGMSALFPGSTDSAGFWRDIVNGTDLVGEVPPDHWRREDYFDPSPGSRDMTCCTRGAFLSPVPFDPVEFALPPAQLPSTDTSQLLALLVARRLLDGIQEGRTKPIDRERTSVLLGVASATELAVQMNGRLQHPIWARALRRHGLPEADAQAIMARLSDSYAPWTEATFPGLLGNVVAGRIANRLDLGGTNCVVDAACASSLSALWLAALELEAGRTDLAITGGVDTINDIFMYMCFSKTTALSPTGDARPFAEDADGTVLGEGIGMFALRRLSDAERDGDTIYAVLKGIGTASDGSGTSVYAPRAEGQVRALRRAYAAAGYAPATVELVEAHGTGTVAGDRVELQALREVFGSAEGLDGDAAPICAIGSVKSQIGHTKAAAGSASLFKAVMALSHAVLPPTIKAERPHAELRATGSPFYLNGRARPWIGRTDRPRRASVSAFGFGGSNYHVALEEYRGPGRRPLKTRTLPAEWVALAADGPDALATALDGMLARLEDGMAFATLARDSQRTFDASRSERLTLVATDAADLGEKLRRARTGLLAGGEAARLPGLYRGSGAAPGAIAFLFPGQGSQSLDMGADLAMAFDVARAAWEEADEAALAAGAGRRLSRVVFPPPAADPRVRAEQAERLVRTEWAQPAIGAATLASLRILEQIGLRPDLVAGHSFGEVSALLAAGAFDAPTAMRVAHVRGRILGEHAQRHPGAMLALIDPSEDLEAWLRQAHPEVFVANHNAPDQLALAGPVEAIAALEADLRARQVPARRLPVGAAFHTPALTSVADAFASALGGLPWAKPAIPVYSNVSARPYPRDGARARTLLAGQIARPVRFAEMLEAMYADGARLFVEVGPGAVLTGLVRRTLGDRALGVALDGGAGHGVTALWHALAALAAAGVPFETEPLWREYAAPNAEAGHRPASAATLLVSGANLGRPYPGAGEPEGMAASERRPAATGPSAPMLALAAPPAQGAPPPPASAPMDPARPARSQEPFGMEAPMAQEEWSSVVPAPLDALRPGPTTGPTSEGPLALLATLQADLTRAHIAYQQALSEGHRAFLATAERSMRLLAGEALGASPETGSLRPVDQPPLAPTVVAPTVMPTAPPSPPAPAAQAPPAPAAQAPPRPSPTAAAAVPPVPAPSSAPVAAPPAPPSDGADDPWPRVRRIVAERTGYPEAMLAENLDLQADLGIDSIKRVEILSAVQAAFPSAPAFDAAGLAALRTLGEVAQTVRGAKGGATAEPDIAAAEVVASPGPAPAGGGPGADPMAVVRETVAEKTGYPLAMLEPALALDADLGIDSIKKVEIFSALQARLPEAGTIDAQEVASLRTLDDVARFLRERIRGPAPAPLSALATAVRPEAGTVRARRVGAVVAEAAGLALPHLVGPDEVLLLGGPRSLARALKGALGAHGITASIARALPAGGGVRRVVVLGGADTALDEEEALALNREAFAAARAVAAAAADGVGLFVTVQDTGGDFGLGGESGERVWLGGLPALVKTLARELPRLGVKAIDVAQDGRTTRAVVADIVAELLRGGPEIEVGYDRAGVRRTLALVGEPVVGASSRPLVDGTVLVATGGGRGVTASAVLGLARTARLEVVLLGRTALVPDVAGEGPDLMARVAEQTRRQGLDASPLAIRRRVRAITASREIRATLAALAASGSRGRYAAVDVRDAPALTAALAQVRREVGPIGAVLHGAGVIRDHLLVDKSDEEVDEVFDTKVLGARNLLAATAADPLTHLAFFASIAGRTGNRGQADYAMANEVLARLAAREGARRGAAVSVQAFAWGPWRGGMVTPELAEHFAREGMDLIGLEAGADLFGRLWQEGQAAGAEWVVLPERSMNALPSVVAATCVDVPVSLERQPQLEDHAPMGVPVVPVALVVEWMVAAAEAAMGGRVRTVERVQVLHGIRLDDAFAKVAPLTLSLSAAGPGAMRCLLTDRSGRPRYRGEVRLTDLTGVPPGEVGGAGSERVDGSPWPFGRRELYEDVLFHGPRFQAVRTLGRISVAGATATLLVRSSAWAETTRTDPLLLDGGLQVLVAWTHARLGRRSLPTAIGRLERRGEALAGTAVEVRVLVRSAARDHVVADLLWLDPAGAPILTAFGVECHGVGEDGRGWHSAMRGADS